MIHQFENSQGQTMKNELILSQANEEIELISPIRQLNPVRFQANFINNDTSFYTNDISKTYQENKKDRSPFRCKQSQKIGDQQIIINEEIKKTSEQIKCIVFNQKLVLEIEKNNLSIVELTSIKDFVSFCEEIIYQGQINTCNNMEYDFQSIKLNYNLCKNNKFFNILELFDELEIYLGDQVQQWIEKLNNLSFHSNYLILVPHFLFHESQPLNLQICRLMLWIEYEKFPSIETVLPLMMKSSQRNILNEIYNDQTLDLFDLTQKILKNPKNKNRIKQIKITYEQDRIQIQYKTLNENNPYKISIQFHEEGQINKWNFYSVFDSSSQRSENYSQKIDQYLQSCFDDQDLYVLVTDQQQDKKLLKIQKLLLEQSYYDFLYEIMLYDYIVKQEDYQELEIKIHSIQDFYIIKHKTDNYGVIVYDHADFTMKEYLEIESDNYINVNYFYKHFKNLLDYLRLYGILYCKFGVQYLFFTQNNITLNNIQNSYLQENQDVILNIHINDDLHYYPDQTTKLLKTDFQKVQSSFIQPKEIHYYGLQQLVNQIKIKGAIPNNNWVQQIYTAVMDYQIEFKQQYTAFKYINSIYCMFTSLIHSIENSVITLIQLKSDIIDITLQFEDCFKVEMGLLYSLIHYYIYTNQYDKGMHNLAQLQSIVQVSNYSKEKFAQLRLNILCKLQDLKDTSSLILQAYQQLMDSYMDYFDRKIGHSIFINIFYRFGNVNLDEKNYQKAIDGFIQTIVIQSNIFSSYNDLCNIIHQKHYIFKEGCCSLSLINIYQKLSLCYFHIGDYQQFKDSIDKAISISSQIFNVSKSQLEFYDIMNDETLKKRFAKSKLQIIKKNYNIVHPMLFSIYQLLSMYFVKQKDFLFSLSFLYLSHECLLLPWNYKKEIVDQEIKQVLLNISSVWSFLKNEQLANLYLQNSIQLNNGKYDLIHKIQIIRNKIRIQNYQEALNDLQDLNSRSIEIVFDTGYCLFKLKKFQECKKYFFNLINQLNIEDQMEKQYSGLCNLFLGEISKSSNLELSLQYFQQSQLLLKDTLDKDHPLFTDIIIRRGTITFTQKQI